ncbi:MAG: hypothetical protein OES32_10780 [Acidobacteriota bacterium]|nr:hypothetical protein [Acidobacteriota bacterium]MDH3524060.1 hypothetical protein [Acidobacteriota bacterium]
MARVPALAAAGLCLLAGALPGRAAAATRPSPFMRGVVVSCPRSGQIWGTELMSEALADIRALGGEWIAIHPYAWIGRDGEVRHRPAAETGYLDESVRRMREAGMEIFWKPHLGYWGSFEWRGAIDLGADEAAWRRFFAGYTEFIVDQARFAERHGVELFAVGVEYERTMHREADWRAVVAAVREVYSGAITYAANWDGIRRVAFWDAVDLIGVHAYFPLAAEDWPLHEALAAGWDAPLDDLESLSAEHGKRVLFAEIGYNRAAHAAREPWAHGTYDTPANRALRRLLMETALDRIEREPWIAGMFWWKWMPGIPGGNDRDFSLKEPEAREALFQYWGRPAGSKVVVTPQ